MARIISKGSKNTMEYQMRNKLLPVIAFLSMAMALNGCTTVANKDPLEGINRGVYKFNDVADKAVIKPVAGAYKAVTPVPVRSGINNFFTNLGTLVTTVNQLLQFKFNEAADSAGRFVINSTFGIAGLIDVASMDGVKQYNEDFGKTLGHYGVGDGAYLVLPFLGPSTVRDTGGLVVDSYAFDPLGYIDSPSVRNSLVATKFLDKRAQYLPASDLVDDAALDPYVFMRDAYLQRRHLQINGKPDTDENFEEYDSQDTAPASAK